MNEKFYRLDFIKIKNYKKMIKGVKKVSNRVKEDICNKYYICQRIYVQKI